MILYCAALGVWLALRAPNAAKGTRRPTVTIAATSRRNRCAGRGLYGVLIFVLLSPLDASFFMRSLRTPKLSFCSAEYSRFGISLIGGMKPEVKPRSSCRKPRTCHLLGCGG